MESRKRAVELCVLAIRTGEHAAGVQAAQALADDVVWVAGQEQYNGRAEVAKRITGQWPMTPVLMRAHWAAPVEDAGQVKVFAKADAVFAPSSFNYNFSFNAAGQVSRIEQESVPGPKPLVTDVIPDFVKTYVNNALANGTPMVFACTNPDGSPNLTMRGATQVYSDTELSIWLRHAEGDTVNAINANPKVAVLYRDSRNRTTLVFHGRAHIATSDDVRNRVFEFAPEVEQNHDPKRLGAAMIIEVERMDGMSPHGIVQVRRTLS